jgi:hypothetical protein
MRSLFYIRVFLRTESPGRKASLDPAEAGKNANLESRANNIRWMKIVLFGLGGIFVLAGLIRQWPILEKTYMQFIEGDGYLSLMLGLIMIVLGFSVRLFMGEEEIR